VGRLAGELRHANAGIRQQLPLAELACEFLQLRPQRRELVAQRRCLELGDAAAQGVGRGDVGPRFRRRPTWWASARTVTSAPASPAVRTPRPRSASARVRSWCSRC